MKKFASVLLFTGAFGAAQAQDSYRYSIDLTKTANDQLQVDLLAPKIRTATATLSFPTIIPGTYRISNYGQFISDVTAYDRSGKKMTVKKMGENKWQIPGAASLHRISYKVDDIFDSEKKHQIFPMSATSFEEGKAMVLNTPGVLGYIDGLRNIPFEVSFKKPQGFYASTSLKPVRSTADTDEFSVPSLDELYDAPIMYSRPDTTTVKVGNCEVLVSVYSPNGMIRSQQIAGWMANLLEGARIYLGGKLPAERYAFIYYFKEKDAKHSFPPGLSGALEHNQSSFYYMFEGPAEQVKDQLVDFSSHEFFHIITPLTISSREVKLFNFDEPVLSRHLWLYEGLTEYTAHHVQVRHGLNTVKQFMDKLSEKITISQRYFNDTLAFTEMSKAAASKYADQYGNVYLKGALISACLDIYLLHLSDGSYGLRNLTYDLGVRFGRDRYFEDEQLFDEIGKLTYPQVKDFLVKYVGSSTPIPYADYFAMAGFKLTPKSDKKVASLGGFMPVPNERGQFVIAKESKFTEMGKKLGLKHGDEVYAFNGVRINQQNIGQVIDNVRKNIKDGDVLTIKVGRPGATGTIDTLDLSAPFAHMTQTEFNKLDPMPNASAKQKKIQQLWLKGTPTSSHEQAPPANPTDVASADAVVKALYDVISGPAGPRNWDRFHSLFYPGGMMGAIVQTPDGQDVYHRMSPKEYQQSNAPFFGQSGFFEEELGRKTWGQGNIISVQSAYQFRLSADGPVAQRGINYFTLIKLNGRWWVSNLIWQDESPQNPIPADLLKK